jgi:hypothetical protein
MNAYYILAIICLSCSALFGYLGVNHESRKSSDEQLSKISREFDNLGEQISALKGTEVTSSDLKSIDKRYQDLAQEYMKVLPAEAQNLLVEKEAYRLEQINQSSAIISQIDIVRNTAKKVVAAFTSKGADIKYHDMPAPANLFTKQTFQLRLQISTKEYWSINLVDREPNKIGLVFVRISRNEGGQEFLTNDSIIFRWTKNNSFFFSLNSNISEEVKRKVFNSLDNNIHPIAEAEDKLERLVVNLVKYMLAKAELEKA